MGFHCCEICKKDPVVEPRYPNTSSGDVVISFAGGGHWVMPDMILHYIADHGWRPPEPFIADVIERKREEVMRWQTAMAGTRVGYLSGDLFQPFSVPIGFVPRLEFLMKQAAGDGARLQTKGLR